MTRTLAILHTVTGLVPVFADLLGRHLPGWTCFNIVDKSLLRVTIRQGELSPQTMRRVAGHIWSALDAEAEAVLVTCSSIGPAVDATQPLCPIPLVRVDEGMVDAALATGNRIETLATLATTLVPTEALMVRRARLGGRSLRSRPTSATGPSRSFLPASDPARQGGDVRNATEENSACEK